MTGKENDHQVVFTGKASKVCAKGFSNAFQVGLFVQQQHHVFGGYAVAFNQKPMKFPGIVYGVFY
jgi:hypothetical protein